MAELTGHFGFEDSFLKRAREDSYFALADVKNIPGRQIRASSFVNAQDLRAEH